MAAKQLSSARLLVVNVSQKHQNIFLHLGWLQHSPLFVCVVTVCTLWLVTLTNLLPFYLFCRCRHDCMQCELAVSPARLFYFC